MNPWRLIGFNSFQAVKDTYKPYISVFKAAAVLASKECVRIGLDFSSSCKRNLPQYLKDVRVNKSLRSFRYWRAVTVVLACVALFAIALNARGGNAPNVGTRAAASWQATASARPVPVKSAGNTMVPALQGSGIGDSAWADNHGGGASASFGSAVVVSAQEGLPLATASTHLPGNNDGFLASGSTSLLQDLLASASLSSSGLLSPSPPTPSSSQPSSSSASSSSLPASAGFAHLGASSAALALRIEPPANTGAGTVVYGEDQRLLPRETVEGIEARLAEAAEKKRQAHAAFLATQHASRDARRKQRRERAAVASSGNAGAAATTVVPASSLASPTGRHHHHHHHTSGPARIHYSTLQHGIHVIITSDASKYQNWQARLCWWTFQKVQPQSDMKWFTRILHSTVTDDLMNVIPTFRVDPVDKNCDKDGGGGFGCEYPVANRPQAIADWLASGGPKGKWVLIVETDYMFIKPIMVPTTPEAVGFPYRYMRMESAKHAHILRRYFPEEKGPLSKIPGTGCSPILIRVEDLVKIVPIWVDLTSRIMHDAEAVSKLAWFREMYTYSIAAALAEVPHKLPAFPKSLIVEPPFQKGKLGQVKMIHIAGRTILEDKDHKKVWMFHKKTWQNGLPPEGIPLPPPGIEVPESVAFMVNLINEALLDMGMITQGPLLEKPHNRA